MYGSTSFIGVLGSQMLAFAGVVDPINVDYARTYSVLGSRSDALSVKYGRNYTVLGSRNDALSLRFGRTYAIIEE